MNRLQHILIAFFTGVYCLVLPLRPAAQTRASDSLLSAVVKAKSDTEKVSLLYTISSITPCDAHAQKLDYALQAGALAEKIGWTKGRLMANTRTADYYAYCTRQYLKAISYYERNLTIARTAGLTDEQAWSLSNMGMTYFSYGRNREALECYQQSIDLQPSQALLTGIYPNMGNVYDKLGDYPRAINNYELAADLLTRRLLQEKKGTADDTATLMGLLITKADLYLKTSQTKKAINNYRLVADFSESITTTSVTNNMFYTWAYLGLGKSYHLQHRDSMAITYFKNALEKSRAAGARKTEATILTAMSNLFLENNDISSAEKYATLSLNIANGTTGSKKGIRDSVLLPQAYITLGKIATHQRRYNIAISYLSDARNICRNTGDRNTEKDALLALSNAFARAASPKDALWAYQQYVAIKDSLFSQDKAREMTMLEMSSEFGRMQLKDSLKNARQEKLAAVRFQRQRSILMGVAVFSVLVVIMVVIVYSSYKKVSGLHKQVSTQKSALEQSNQEKGRILHIVAHDLRNPVGSIAYISEMMLMDGRTKEELEDSLKTIHNTSQSSLMLINELSGFDDQIPVEDRATEDIGSIVAECAQMMTHKAAEKKQTLCANLPPNPVYAPVVKEKIARAINNLLGNAIKFSKQGQDICLSVTSEPNHVIIAVSDHGIGIPEDKKDGLFEIFTRSKRYGTNGEKPFGLGLYVSRQIIELHNGSITYESKENEGTTFFVRLPRKDMREEK